MRVAFDFTPDLANAISDSFNRVQEVEGPRHAQSFDDLTESITQTPRLIQHLEAFRGLAIVASDRTGPYVDRKALAIAGGMPPSRLYRLLEKHGRPRDRKAQTADRTTEK
jgi:hypothetical protein